MNEKFIKIFSCFIPFKKARRRFRYNLLNQFGLSFPFYSYYKIKVKKMCAKDDRIQVFIAGSGAVAEYAIKIYKEMPDKFVIFTNVKTIKELKHLKNLAPNCKNFIYPLYKNFKFKNNINKIFYLGNSSHYCNIFKILVSTKGIQNRYIVLPDIATFGASNLGLDEIKKIIRDYYPEIKDKSEALSPENIMQFLSTNNISLARWLIDVTGVNNLIEMSDKGYNFLTKELKHTNNYNICKLEPVIPKIELSKTKKVLNHKHKYIVGTFGIPDNMTKGTDKIIKAIQILNAKNDIGLLLCGYGVENYSQTIENKENLYFYEKPDYKTFLNLMNSCDVIVQLRENHFTFASGCMAEALGLGKPLIITMNMANDDWNNITVSVEEGVNTQELAEKILFAINNKIGNTVDSNVYDNYSCLNNCKAIYNFVNNQVFIHETAFISGLENITIGEYSWIGDHCRFHAGKAGLHIGSRVAIAHEVMIITNNHNYQTNYIPFDNRAVSRPIYIGDNVWIGTRVIILPGVKIEEGAIIGAGSVITKSIPKCAIVAGNPARIVGWRDKELYEDCKIHNRYSTNKKIPACITNEELIIVNKYKEYLEES